MNSRESTAAEEHYLETAVLPAAREVFGDNAILVRAGEPAPGREDDWGPGEGPVKPWPRLRFAVGYWYDESTGCPRKAIVLEARLSRPLPESDRIKYNLVIDRPSISAREIDPNESPRSRWDGEYHSTINGVMLADRIMGEKIPRTHSELVALWRRVDELVKEFMQSWMMLGGGAGSYGTR